MAQHPHRPGKSISLILAVFLLVACAGAPEAPRDYGISEEPVEPDTPRFMLTESPQPAPVVAADKGDPATHQVIAIRPNTPDSYTVKKGDTLWDIASLFLRDPWLWPEIWYFNPQIENPHLIYPGDVITLIYVDGKPQLRLARDGVITLVPPSTDNRPPKGIETVKLSPRIREESLSAAIPTIPVSLIQPFLVSPRIITAEELEQAPYILSSQDHHLVSASGNIIYVRGLKNENEIRYHVFRPGRVFRNPHKRQEILGYETLQVSEAKLVKSGDPATLVLTRSMRETLNGDRILPAEQGEINYHFIPRAPTTEVNGQIIAFIDAISHIAQNQVVVINLGKREGLEAGNVLDIEQTGSMYRDKLAPGGEEHVKLPNTRVGVLMVFRVFDRVSYALIMKSTRTIHLNDTVLNPAPVADVIAP